MKKNKVFVTILLLFIAFQPVFDLITSVTNWIISLPISFNIIIKLSVLCLVIIYLFFYSKSKYKKISLIYLILLASFCIVYLLTKLDLKTLTNFANEITYIFKFNYWIVLAIGYINVFSDNELDKNKFIKCLQINAILYFVFLMVPIITNSSFATYTDNTLGRKGWFYAANELACLLSLLIPYLFLFFSQKDKKWFDYVAIVLGLIAMLSIGLKTTFASLILTSLVLIIFFMKKHYKDYRVYLVLGCLVLLFTLTYKKIPGFDIWINNNYAAKFDYKDNDTFFDKLTTTLFHTRKPLFIEKKQIYSKASITDKFFGIGFTNREKYSNQRVSKLVEIDPADVFFGFGIIGFIIYLLPFIYLIISIFKNNWKRIFVFDNYIYLYVFLLSIFISCFAGHVYGAPSVSIYVALAYCQLILLENKNKN